MHRRFGLRAAAAALIGLAQTGCGVGRSPNVVIVSLDTLRRSELRSYSQVAPARPNLDALAARSAVFLDALSTAPWTLPAHGSVFTGLYPDRHGATDPRRRLDSAVPILGELMRAAGYRCVAFTDGGFVDRRFGFDRGCQRYDDGGDVSVQVPRGGRPNAKARQDVFDRALAYLASPAAQDAPLFLFAHTYAVHDYYMGLPGHKSFRGCLQGRVECTPDEWDRLKDRYASEVGHADEAFGRLLAAVERLPGKTFLVVLSDHGEGLDPAQKRIHHGGRLHADLIAVPLLISGPSVEPGQRRGEVSLVDVMPTLLDVLRQPVPAGLDGRSFAASLAGGVLAPRGALFAMEHYYAWPAGIRTAVRDVQERALGTAVIQGSRWYIASGSDQELYDSVQDPEQRTALPAGDSPLRNVASQRGRVLATGATVPLEALDESLREQLRGLGYVE